MTRCRIAHMMLWGLFLGCILVSPGNAAENDTYALTATLRAAAVLEVPGFPVALKWKMIGTAITASGDQVVSGYFYADPDDFAYGSQYNPELFVKVYIATNGWCNIAFNHVTVDPVSIYSEHRATVTSIETKTGSATLSSRLVEHQYDGVAIDTTLTSPPEGDDACILYTSDLWAEAYIESQKMIWKPVGSDITPSGDQVISGYFYALPEDLQDGNRYNPEMFVKIYISNNGWANIAFNHVTVSDIEISSAHHYSGQPDQTGTISLDQRLLEHPYEGGVAAAGQDHYDITVSTRGHGSIAPVLFGDPEDTGGDCQLSVPRGGSQTFALSAGRNYYLEDVNVDGVASGVGHLSDYHTLEDVSTSSTVEAVFGKYIVGGNPLGGLNATDLVVSGNLAYVVNLEGGFGVVDVGDPAQSVVTGWVDTPGEATGIAVLGDYAYVADGYAGIAIVDIRDPQNPEIVCQVDLPGNTVAMVCTAERAYAIDDAYGLSILDLTAPTAPTLIGAIDAAQTVTDLVVSGNLACYLDSGVLQVVDIADATNPVHVSQTDVGDAIKLTVSGSYAYVASLGEDAFQVVDIADPANPMILGRTDLSGGLFSGLVAYGDHVYASYSYAYGLGTTPHQIIDISDPSNPMVVGRLEQAGGKVYAVGGLAYVAHGRLSVVDVGDPSSPTTLGTSVRSGVGDIQAVGDDLYVTQSGQGMTVLDISDPIRPVTAGRAALSDLGTLVHVDGNTAFVDTGVALALVDIEDPVNPVVIGQTGIPDAESVDVSGEFAYVGRGSAGFAVVDIRDPANPVVVGSLDDAMDGVVVVGTYVYGGEWYTGLKVVDVADPVRPVVVWRNDQYVAMQSLAVSGRYAYVVGNYAYLGEVEYGISVVDLGAMGAGLGSDATGQSNPAQTEP